MQVISVDALQIPRILIEMNTVGETGKRENLIRLFSGDCKDVYDV